MVQKDNKIKIYAIVELEPGKMSGYVKKIHSENMEINHDSNGKDRFNATSGLKAVYCGYQTLHLNDNNQYFNDVKANVGDYWDGVNFIKK